MHATTCRVGLLRLVLVFIILFSLVSVSLPTNAQKPGETSTPTEKEQPVGSSQTRPTPTASPTPDVLLPTVPITPLTPEELEKQRKEQEIDVIKTDIVMVDVTATVFDNYDHYFPGLTVKDFEIKEDGVKQDIILFDNTSGRVNIVIDFDTSGSMEKDKIEKAKQALAVFLKTCHPLDGIVLYSFAEKTRLLQDLITNHRGGGGIDAILNKLTFVEAKGQTAIFDPLLISIKKLLEVQKHPDHKKEKTAMLIISDGQDNNSRATFEDVKRALKESNIVIYAIVIPPSSGMDMSNGALAGKEMLAELARITGGRAYLPDFPMSLRFPSETLIERPYMSPEEAAERIALELRHQYSIAYSPTNKSKDGKWRKIKVKVIPPPGVPRLNVRAKEGYYAPGAPTPKQKKSKKLPAKR